MGYQVQAKTFTGQPVVWELSPEGIGMNAHAAGLTFEAALALAECDADVFAIGRGWLEAEGSGHYQTAMCREIDEREDELGDY